MSQEGNQTLAQMDQERGNTKSLSSLRVSGAKRWLWTWNNYPIDWLAQMAPVFRGCEWIAGYEIAPSTNTPHLQGYTEFPVKVRPMGYKGAPKEIHWGDAKGKPAKGDRQQNINYCTKEGKVAGGTLEVEVFDCQEPYGWQLKVLEIVDSPIVRRKIYWFWEPDGNVGKSDVVRHLCIHNEALMVAGKASDMKFMMVNAKKKPKLVIIDVPRSMKEYISYTGLEEISNATFASNKYEGKMYIGPYPHVFVFANFKPRGGMDMSIDRYDCWRIDAASQTCIYDAVTNDF